MTVRKPSGGVEVLRSAATGRTTHGSKRRYLVAGVANTALSLGLYWLLFPGLGAVPAYVLAFWVTVLTGYAIHSRWVFREPWHWAGLLRFPLAQLLNLAVGTALIAALVYVLAVPAWLAPVLAVYLLLALYGILRFRLENPVPKAPPA